ncbi:MAG: hypothetical protein RL015_301 [Verrucomicrobiota bacterium]
MSDKKPKLWRRYVVNPILQQLTQGVTPPKIAQAIAYGVTLGIFPILGSSTLLTLVVGVPMRLNQPVLQVFKTLMYPVQLTLLLAFYRAGEWLFQAPHVSIHIPTMLKRFFAEPGPFFRDYGMTAVYGITVWLLMAPFLLGILYFTTKPMVTKLSSLYKTRALSALHPSES